MEIEDKEISNRVDALDILREVGKTLTGTLDPDQVLRVIMEMVAKLFQPKNWSLLMVDEEADELYFAVVVGDEGDQLKDVRLKMGEGIAGWSAKHGEPVIITDAYKDPRFASWVDDKSGFKTESVVCVPMISKGRTLGVIEIFNIPPQSQEPERIELLGAFADFAAIAIENSLYVSRIRELTIIDDCTGLYNARHMHTLLDTEISRSVRYNTSFTLVFLDLDYFKEINDKHGHLVGSKLLREIGSTIRCNLRTVDWAIRYGGDEFVIILPQTSNEEALIVVNRLRDSLNKAVYFQKEGLDIRITASFGLATYPEDAINKEDIIRLADQAMYRVKESTRNGIQVAGKTGTNL